MLLGSIGRVEGPRPDGAIQRGGHEHGLSEVLERDQRHDLVGVLVQEELG